MLVAPLCEIAVSEFPDIAYNAAELKIIVWSICEV